MKRKLAVFCSIILFLLVVPISVYVLTYAQSPELAPSKVVYQLPYPGILPDHPLYILKQIRDKLLIFLTRDLSKKSELLLLISDKKIAMSLQLAKKGKEKLAIQTVEGAEEDFIQLIKVIKEAKKQGNSLNEGFMMKVSLSNEKHREVIQSLIGSLSRGVEESLSRVLKTNQQIRRKINKL